MLTGQTHMADIDGQQDAHVRAAISHRLRMTHDYAVFNYGQRSKIAQACASGDARAFMSCTNFVTQNTDIKLSNLQDYIAFRLPGSMSEA